MKERKNVYVINKPNTVTYQVTTEIHNEIKGSISCFKYSYLLT
jgi:hypothetical protein